MDDEARENVLELQRIAIGEGEPGELEELRSELREIARRHTTDEAEVERLVNLMQHAVSVGPDGLLNIEAYAAAVAERTRKGTAAEWGQQE